MTPIMLFAATLAVANPVISMPAPWFESIVLPRAEVAPPIWFCDPSSISTPAPRFPGSPVPNLYPPPGATPM